MVRVSRRPGSPSLFDLTMIVLLLAAIVIQAATIFDLFWPQATFASYIVQLLVFLFYLVFPLPRVRLAVVIPAVAIILFLIFEHILFARLAEQPYNFNAILQYFPLLSFLPLYRSRVSITTILKVLFAVSTIYMLIYVAGHNLILSGALGENRSIHDGDTERGARLYLASGFASFVVYYALTSYQTPFLRRALIFFLATYAIWLSGFRTFGLLFLAIMLLSSIRLLGLGTRIALFSFFLLISGVLLAGLAIPGWNPFQWMSWDGSAYARSLEYDIAVESIHRHWIFGIGLPGSFGDLQTFLRTPEYEPLYATDLGVIGPLILFGIPGTIAFLMATYFCVIPSLGRNDGSGYRGLQLNGILCAMMGVISPSLLLEQNALFFSILLVAWVREGPLLRPLPTEKLWFEAIPLDHKPLWQSITGRFTKADPDIRKGSHYEPPKDTR